MSGANSRPWEFIVVTEPDAKKALRYLYSLREVTVPVHSSSRSVKVEEK